MSTLLQKLAQIRERRIFAESAFDVKSIWSRLASFKPTYILIDDNIGHHELVDTVHALAHDRRTKNIPITVLKNSNYRESILSVDVIDYVLKQSLTPEALFHALKNSLKIKRAGQYLVDAYRKRRKLLLALGR